MKYRLDVRRCWLCLPAIPLAILDGTLTLLGQSKDYWAGNYHLALEANPLARLFLVWNPLAFQLILAAWIVFFVAVIFSFSRSVAIVVSFLVTFAHCVGSATWLWRKGTTGIIVAVAIFVAAERLVDLAWRKLEKE